RGHLLAQILDPAMAGGELRGDRREDVAPVKGGARVVHAEPREWRRPEAHDEGFARAGNDRREQAVVGCEEVMAPGTSGDDMTRSTEAGIDSRHVHGTGRKVVEGSCEPEAGLGGPVHDDLVREIDEARLRESREDTALDDTDEWALMPKVGR